MILPFVIMVSLVQLTVEIVQLVEVEFADVDNRFPLCEIYFLVQMRGKDRILLRVKSSKLYSVGTTSDLPSFLKKIIS